MSTTAVRRGIPVFPGLRLRLIDDIHRAHKFASLQLCGAFAFIVELGPHLAATWGLMPPSLRDVLPTPVQQSIATSAFVLIALGRIVKLDHSPRPGNAGQGDDECNSTT